MERGARGRGLFYQPNYSSGSSGRTREDAYTAGSLWGPHVASGVGGAAGVPPEADRALVRVPLAAALTLVTDGGPVELQQELLDEWQVGGILCRGTRGKVMELQEVRGDTRLVGGGRKGR